MTDSLLPHGASKLELDLEQVVARAAEIPVDIKNLYNPALCPVAFLPWLAWAFNVNVWSDNWSEQQKRDTIEASFVTHATKGTPGSITRQIDALGYISDIEEWFNRGYAPYTFDVNINTGSFVFNDELTEPVKSIIDKYKNIRSRLNVARFFVDGGEKTYIGASYQLGSTITLGEVVK